MSEPSSTVTYDTHMLLGLHYNGNYRAVARWEYAPSAAEVQGSVDRADKDFTSFVLVSPCGPVLPGNRPPPTSYEYGGC